jgi:hypothetical protein
MAAASVAIPPENSGQVGIQEETADKGTMDTGVACLAGQFTKDLVPEIIMITGDMFYMTLAAKLVFRLAEQAIVFAAVRIMAFHASATFRRISIHGLMLVQERPAFIGMAVLAYSVKIIGKITAQTFGELMAIQAGHISLHDGMVGPPLKFRDCFGVAFLTKGSFTIQKQGRLSSVDFMTLTATQFLIGMYIESVIIQRLMSQVAIRAGFDTIMSRQHRWINNIFRGWVFDMNFTTGMTADAIHLYACIFARRIYLMNGAFESFIHIFVAVEAGFIIWTLGL